jgi:hypothetical protein
MASVNFFACLVGVGDGFETACGLLTFCQFFCPYMSYINQSVLPTYPFIPSFLLLKKSLIAFPIYEISSNESSNYISAIISSTLELPKHLPPAASFSTGQRLTLSPSGSIPIITGSIKTISLLRISNNAKAELDASLALGRTAWTGMGRDILRT